MHTILDKLEHPVAAVEEYRSCLQERISIHSIVGDDDDKNELFWILLSLSSSFFGIVDFFFVRDDILLIVTFGKWKKYCKILVLLS